MGLCRCWVYKNPLPTIINYCFDRKFHFLYQTSCKQEKQHLQIAGVFLFDWWNALDILWTTWRFGESWKMQGTTFWWSEGILLNLLLLDMPLVMFITYITSNQRSARDFNANILQDTEKSLVTDEVLQKFPEIHLFFFITRRLNSLQGRFDKARSSWDHKGKSMQLFETSKIEVKTCQN